MLPYTLNGKHGPLIVMLHWLGGSANTWTEVSAGLVARDFRCAALDLPGFGRAVDDDRFSVAQMSTAVLETVRGLRGAASKEPWFLAGHSMGGKLAAVLTRAAENGEVDLQNLRGVFLVSPSPPGVEPMTESKREDALRDLGQSTGDAEKDREHAKAFVDDNVGKLALPEAIEQRTTADVLHMSRAALRAWMTGGSKEDWAERVGTLSTPALVLAGTEESALNPAAQRKHTLAHFSRATLVPLEGSSHLGPLERPWELIEHITDFVASLGMSWPERTESLPATTLSPGFLRLIDSDCTSPQTRSLLLQRLTPQAFFPAIFTSSQRHAARALARRVVPAAPQDLASKLEEQLTRPQQDGSRRASLPADADAWLQGLASFEAASKRTFGVPFAALDGARQDELLKQAAAGTLGRGLLGALYLGAGAESFTPEQMKDWFEDVRGELAKLYMTDPRTLERVGFTGFADDHGFTHIRLGELEDFENTTAQARQDAR